MISHDLSHSILQSIATLISGSIIGLIFAWKLALVGIGELSFIFHHLESNDVVACIPVLVTSGYIRLVRMVCLRNTLSDVFIPGSLACR